MDWQFERKDYMGAKDHQANLSATGATIELLFGKQLGEIDTSLCLLDKQLVERVDKAEDEMRARVESLDQITEEQIESLSRVIEPDKTAELTTETASSEIERHLEQMMGDLDHHYKVAQKDLEDRIAEAADSTTQLRQSMDQDIAKFKTSLAARDELAGMFAELGKRLEPNASGMGLG